MSRLSNLPPGVTDDMIPGNRPEDVEWGRLYDFIEATGIEPKALKGLVTGWWKRTHRNEEPPK